MRIAIMGAGSLGTVIGAFIAEKHADVVLVDVNEPHVQALNEKGASVVGATKKTTQVIAITPEEMTEHYDLILLLTKIADSVISPKMKSY